MPPSTELGAVLETESLSVLILTGAESSGSGLTMLSLDSRVLSWRSGELGSLPRTLFLAACSLLFVREGRPRAEATGARIPEAPGMVSSCRLNVIVKKEEEKKSMKAAKLERQ
jgi:hypothetical protein